MPNPSAPPNSSRTVLVVDDEPDLCELLVGELESLHFKVISAVCGDVALALMHQHQVDLVVSDIRMPRMDGVTLLRRVRQEIAGGGPPFILTTGYAEISLEDAFNLGACGIFAKPVNYEALLAAVKRTIDRSQRCHQGKLRLDTDIPMQLQFVTANQAKLAVRTLNIGRGGAFVAMDGQFPPVGAKFPFSFIFSDGKFSPIEGIAICRWHRQSSANPRLPAGVGVEFEQLAPAARSNLLQLLNAIQTSAYIPKS